MQKSRRFRPSSALPGWQGSQNTVATVGSHLGRRPASAMSEHRNTDQNADSERPTSRVPEVESTPNVVRPGGRDPSVLSTPLSADKAARLKGQKWRCAYPCSGKGYGRPLLAGESVALAYDGYGIIHAECAVIGTVPIEGNPWSEGIGNGKAQEG